MSDIDYDHERRARSKILRVTPEVDALVRAYADKHGCTPYEAAERLIERSETDRAQLERLAIKLGRTEERARGADLVAAALSAVGFPRQDGEPLDRTFARAWAWCVSEAHKAQSAARAAQEALAQLQANAAPCACSSALPGDYEAKIAERAKAKGATPEAMFAEVLKLGVSRYDALATAAAKRRAGR